MTKSAFLAQLRTSLASLPQSEIEERLTFYSEMIDDRMEEGLSEEEAVAAVESAEEISAPAADEIPSVKISPKNRRAGRRKAWVILLLVLGSPIWLALLISVLAVILTLYISLWAVLISLWSAFVSIAGTALAGAAAGIILAVSESIPAGLALFSAALVCAGLAIFAFFACRAASKGTILLTKKLIRLCFAKKEEA